MEKLVICCKVYENLVEAERLYNDIIKPNLWQALISIMPKTGKNEHHWSGTTPRRSGSLKEGNECVYVDNP